MRGYEKEIIQAGIKNEEEVIKQLKQLYSESLDQINTRISELMAKNEAQQLQSIIYQLDYQKALKKQISGILDQLQASEYEKISDFLNNTYQDGFIGSMYSMKKQGIPLIIPMDQEQILNAIVHKSKISEGLYKSLGFNVNELKKRISAEVSRGIANGFSYQEIARNINNTSKIGINKAVRIARTEGHRIQAQAQLDASHKAKKKGADVVKQWDATLDGRTRPSHRKLDGQIRELDEPFEIGGHKAQAPSQFGRPSEDINCRCVILQRARWGLDEEELKTLEERAKYHGLDKTKDFEEYKEKYLKAIEKEVRIQETQSSFIPAKTMEEAQQYMYNFMEGNYGIDKKMLSKIKNVDGLNQLNETLTLLQAKYPTQKLDYMIEVRSGSWGAGAYNQLHISPKVLNQKPSTTFKEVYGEGWTKRIDNELARLNGYLEDPNYSTSYEKIKRAISQTQEMAKYKRGNVIYKGKEIKSVYTHEYGHILSDQKIQLNTFDTSNYKTQLVIEKVKQTYKKAIENGDIYNISYYASTRPSEFFAETFAMYEIGEEELPSYIVEMIKEVINYGN